MCIFDVTFHNTDKVLSFDNETMDMEGLELNYLPREWKVSLQENDITFKHSIFISATGRCIAPICSLSEGMVENKRDAWLGENLNKREGVPRLAQTDLFQ